MNHPQNLNIHPVNPNHFNNLLSLYRTVRDICTAAGVRPILHGSLAYAFYTQDPIVTINDIDFLGHSCLFSIIVEVAAEKPAIRCQKFEHVVKIFEGDTKIALHSFEMLHHSLPADFNSVSINRQLFEVVTPMALREIYCRGTIGNPQKEVEYRRKIENLDRMPAAILRRSSRRC